MLLMPPGCENRQLYIFVHDNMSVYCFYFICCPKVAK